MSTFNLRGPGGDSEIQSVRCLYGSNPHRRRLVTLGNDYWIEERREPRSGHGDPDWVRLADDEIGAWDVATMTGLQVQRLDARALMQDDPFSGVPLPESLDTPVFLAAWGEWLVYRRQEKLKKWKRITIELALREYAKLGSQVAAEGLRYAMACGWQAPHFKGSRPPAQTQKPMATANRQQHIADFKSKTKR